MFVEYKTKTTSGRQSIANRSNRHKSTKSEEKI